MVVNLGRRYSDGSPGEMLIAQVVGINVERTALGAMDPNAAYDANGQTVQIGSINSRNNGPRSKN